MLEKRLKQNEVIIQMAGVKEIPTELLMVREGEPLVHIKTRDYRTLHPDGCVSLGHMPPDDTFHLIFFNDVVDITHEIFQASKDDPSIAEPTYTKESFRQVREDLVRIVLSRRAAAALIADISAKLSDTVNE